MIHATVRLGLPVGFLAAALRFAAAPAKANDVLYSYTGYDYTEIGNACKSLSNKFMRDYRAF